MSRTSHLETQVKTILHALANAPAHKVPEVTLEAAHDYREALILPFQQAVIQAHALSADGRLQAEGDWRLHCFALHFFAAWRVPGSYDLILKSLMLADRYDSRWLMGHADEEWPHLLITNFDGDVDRLFRILREDAPPWNSDLRSCCVILLAGVYHHQLGDRAAIEAGFGEMLDVCDTSSIGQTVALCIARAKMSGLLPKLRQWIKTQRSFGTDVQAELEEFWDTGFKNHATYPNPINDPRQDLADIIRNWHYFMPPFIPPPEMVKTWTYQWEMKVQDPTCRPGPSMLPKRTLPCTCGSGLPYGACCIAK